MSEGDGKEASEAKPEPVFKSLSAEDPAQEPTEIESLCVNCGENGITKLLLTKIPHYREVILMSFSCEECGFTNNEIQPGGRMQELGVCFDVRIETERDLSRQVVKSDYATIKVPEIDLEIPPSSQKGAITTVEGILQRTVAGLQQDQPVRKTLDPEAAAKIDEYVAKIEDLLALKSPFHIILRDPSGNSFIENLRAPLADPQRDVSTFVRSSDEDHMLGIYTREELAEAPSDRVPTTIEEEEEAEDNHPEEKKGAENINWTEEVLNFPTNCPQCNAPATTNMKVTNIPHFKEVIIMATVCEVCGHKTNEVKSGAGIEPTGKKITLRITDPSDMSRDVLKSEMCSLMIPELDFEVGGGALGGRFTTLEGLLKNVHDQLEDNPFLGTSYSHGDGSTDETRQRMDEFFKKLNELIEGKKEFTFILDDPTGNSYLQNLYAPDPDPGLTEERYERTFDQNEMLGLNDMKTENYGEK